jgi:hypothetical protein
MSTQHATEVRDIGPQNRRILDTLTDAYRASLELAEQGYTVLDVRIKGRNPVIQIQHSPRCRGLRGVSAAVRLGEHGREQVMVASVKGCQVSWVVRGN